VGIGDVIGFLNCNHQERSTRIVRLDDKPVSLMCGQLQWRLAYGLLHRLVGTSASSGEALELEIFAPQPGIQASDPDD
jgi:hypothetical protein